MPHDSGSNALRFQWRLFQAGWRGVGVGVSVVYGVLGFAAFIRDEAPGGSPVAKALTGIPLIPDWGWGLWLSVGLALLAAVLAAGAYRVTREAESALAECHQAAADLAAVAPRLEVLETEVWQHGLERVYRLQVENLGASASFWGSLRVVQPTSPDAWTAEWGRGDNLVGSPRVHIARGETLRIVLARVSPINVDGVRVAVHALDGGQRVYAWSSDDAGGQMPQCIVELTIFSEPVMALPVRARFQIDRYNFRRVDL